MRIISGTLRGRELGEVAEGIRPTTDRVRESLFSILGAMEGRRVLDLFAGTGALGIESHSRGAERVVWVERSPRIAAELSKRLARLGLSALPQLELIVGDAARTLARWEAEGVRHRFDLVFFDPPYGAPERIEWLEALLGASVLEPGATVVVEGSRRHPLPALAGARVLDERRYGETVLTWLVRAEHDGGE